MTTELTVHDALHIATARYEDGDFHASLELCVQILSIAPGMAQAWNLAGLSALMLGAFGRAAEYFTQCYDLCGDRSVLVNLAETHRRAGNLKESIMLLERLLDDEPNSPMLLYNLARSLQDFGDFYESERRYRDVISLMPDDTDALYNLANLLSDKKSLRQESSLDSCEAWRLFVSRASEAVSLYIRAISLGGQSVQNLALTLTSLGRLDEAISLYKQLCDDACVAYELLFNYANALSLRAQKQDLKLAENLYLRAISISQNSAYKVNLAYLYLRQNDLKHGLRLYEARRELIEEGLLEGNTRIWKSSCVLDSCGEILSPDISDCELKGMRILLFCEQGFGDTLMFSRFIPILQKVAKEVIFIPQRELFSLFLGVFSTAQNTRIVQAIPKDCEFDIAIPLPSLPLALGVSDVRFDSPLLIQNVKNRVKKSQKMRIAFVYASHSKIDTSVQKSIPPRIFLEALSGLDVELFSFQMEGLSSALCAEFGVNEVGSTLDDFGAVASELASMDFAISVDTAFAHLCGALGIPLAILLPKYADWRYGIGGRSAWYEDVRLFFQSELGSWSEPLEELAEFLHSRILSF